MFTDPILLVYLFGDQFRLWLLAPRSDKDAQDVKCRGTQLQVNVALLYQPRVTACEACMTPPNPSPALPLVRRLVILTLSFCTSGSLGTGRPPSNRRPTPRGHEQLHDGSANGLHESLSPALAVPISGREPI